jgi:hypothetical protein
MCHFHGDDKLYIFTKTNKREASRPIFFNLPAVPNEELVCRLNTKDKKVPTQIRS